MLRRKKEIVGLDLGSHAIKMVRLVEGKAGYRLDSLGMAMVPHEAFSEGRIEKPELIADVLRKLAKNLQIKPGPVATSVSGYEVMIKTIEMPSMSEEEVEKRLRGEIAQYVPYQLEEVNVDFEILDLSKERPHHMEVLLVAAKKESVAEYAALIEKAGFEPAVVDVDYFALGNAFEAVHGVFPDQDILLMDIGATKTTLTIVRGGRPVFMRDLMAGGRSITERIASELQVDVERAERIKLGLGSEQVEASRLEAAFMGAVGDWLADVRRAMDFYYTTYPESRIHKIYLSGGSARLPGLDALVKNELGVDVDLFNPLLRLEAGPNKFDPDYLDQVGPQMAICVGLGLRRADDK
ncbi:type IV pilus assembly protein PilM [Desulfacinum hydrothermale DSM 13146]|uniref:Type IV pilus assembly protein PilM n=1 Tax=Desulfacinum hydrothermale DSM 13146 TaxID=1121390 RepID=A0A1W1X1U9_9BACT|nr:type IV pilus assembly protein PilM [Desulfacinum hydrothermale]SMC17936.1 type IV pilus assembly protein PilM [Desulfacinum hydrothermale DSM 13146]